MSGVYVTAIIEARSGKTKQVGDILAGVVEKVRAEPGCIRYDLHEAPEQGTFLFYEIWESAEALEAHAQTPHLAAMRDDLEGLINGPARVELWQARDVR